MSGLWATPVGERFTLHGQHYALEDSPALPKPAQAGGPPIIVGGQRAVAHSATGRHLRG